MWIYINIRYFKILQHHTGLSTSSEAIIGWFDRSLHMWATTCPWSNMQNQFPHQGPLPQISWAPSSCYKTSTRSLFSLILFKACSQCCTTSSVSSIIKFRYSSAFSGYCNVIRLELMLTSHDNMASCMYTN
jgi:hypothetical protein